MNSRKLSPGLQVFARDHGIGLLCAQLLRQAVRASEEDRTNLSGHMQSVCFGIITSALEDERRVLSAVVAQTGLGHPFQEHHFKVTDLISELGKSDPEQDPGLGTISRIADALDDYVRWEENSLFPAIESQLSAEELEQLEAITLTIEEHRKRPTQMLHQSVAPTGGDPHLVGCPCCQGNVQAKSHD